MKQTTKPTPGRPRQVSIDAAVLDATRVLLTERDYGELSISAIAERAGTTRQAVYRRWPNKALIVLDAMFSDTAAVDPPDLGDLRAELRMSTMALAGEFNNPVARATVSGLLSDLATDEELHAKVRTMMLEPEHAKVQTIFERAAARGEIERGLPVDVLVQMIGGGVVYRTCFMGLPADADFVDAVVDTALSTTRKAGQ